MIGWMRSRGGSRPTPYHVRRAEHAARQLGGLLAIVAVVAIGFHAANGTWPHPQAIAALSALLTTGATLLALSEVLGRRHRLWAAQGLLGIGAAILLGCAVLVAAAFWEVERTESIACPLILGVIFGAPITWHSARAVRELRRVGPGTPVGFQPVLAKAVMPVEAMDDTGSTGDAQRTDTSR